MQSAVLLAFLAEVTENGSRDVVGKAFTNSDGVASVSWRYPENDVFAFLCKLIIIPVNIFLLMMTWGRIQALGGV